MNQISVIGSSAFTMGFELIGVSKSIEATQQNAFETITKTMQDHSISVIIIDEALLTGVHREDRQKIEDSVRPVVVVLSKEATSQSLRQSIIRAIGVDLMKEE